MADRPLMQRTIVDLEAMFSSSPEDANVLNQLSIELKHRNVPRALALYQKVQKALDVGDTPKPQTSPRPATNEAENRVSRMKTTLAKASAEHAQGRQPELWSDLQPAATPPAVHSMPAASPPQKDVPLPKSRTGEASSPAMSVEDAYRVLKATPASGWESIEVARRESVQCSSPVNIKLLDDASRSEFLTGARRANQAYLILCDARRTFTR